MEGMADLIKLLPEHVASQIAAGEVIQRPASVVKELLDNALDARATEIQVILKDAGKSLIQVNDNGSGMSLLDARMCWERHATSKIARTEDIYQIRTMGFRGEALASIASVAQVEMKTRREEDELGTHILIEGSEVKRQEVTAAPTGTSILVKNLFFNIPARRNFLKSNPVELKHLIEEFNRAALANNNVTFRLYHQDELQLDYPQATQQERVLQVFQDRSANDLIVFEEQTSIVQVSGFVVKPELAKRVRGEQYFFVNHRFFRDNYLNHAVTNAFEGTISKEQFPGYVIFIEIDPAKIDVNVHPTKVEVKFEDERNVYQILRAVVRRALGDFLKSPGAGEFDDNQFIQLHLNPPALSELRSQPPPVKQGNAGNDWSGIKETYREQRTQKNQPWEQLFQKAVMPDSEKSGPVESFPETEVTRVFFQLNNQYVVTPIKSGLMLIHQQRAHERILYEQYLQAFQHHAMASQQLLFPKVIRLSKEDGLLLEELLPEIGALGFSIAPFGNEAYVINGLPAELHLENELELVESLLETYRQNLTVEPGKTKNVARSLAKRASIKPGTRMQPEEMHRLVDSLFACAEPRYSPDGRPCVSKLTLEEIGKMF